MPRPTSTLRFLFLAAFSALGLCAAAGAQVKRVTRPLLRPQNFAGLRFFPSLKWRITLGMTAHTVPALADLDLDGRTDILIPAADGNLYRLTDDGSVVWKAAMAPQGDPVEELGGALKPGDAGSAQAEEEEDSGRATAGVTLGDVDRDGTLDILVAQGSTLLCLTPEGKERWNVRAGAPIHSFPTVADLDGDGKPEVLFGANDNSLHVLTGAGKQKWSFETKSWVVGGIAAADLDGNGRLEAVFGSMDYKVYCVDSSGKLVWELETGDWVQTSPCIADVDRDGSPDVVVASDDGTLYCVSSKGTLKWKEQLGGQQRLRAFPAVADLDGDGTLETVIALPDGRVMAYTAFGDRAWVRSVNAPVMGSPLVADLNGDGWQDILLATARGQIMSLDTWGNVQWQHYLGHVIESTPVLDDLDRDGKYEIYLANVIAPARRVGFFSQYEISVAGGKGSWVALQGDAYRTGFAPNASDYAAALRRGPDYATAWEPFLAGYRPQTGVQPPRRLRISVLPLEDVQGNHDGALDPGETAVFRVQVTNTGRGASYDSLLTVDFGRSPLKLDRPLMFLGWIAPDATKTVSFRLSAPAMTHPMSTAEYRAAWGDAAARMQVRESGVQAAVAQARVLKVPPLPPVVRVRGRRILDGNSAATSGNGNRTLDAGETVLLRLLLRNDSLTTASGAVARLASGSPDVLVATPAVPLGDVVPYGSRPAEFSLRVARQVAGRNVTLTLTTEARSAPPHVEQIKLPLLKGPVDTTAPLIVLSSPRARITTTAQPRTTIAGTVSDASGVAAFQFQGQPVSLSDLTRVGPGRYRFALERELKVGENVFPITAADAAGNSVTLWVRVVRRP